MIDPDYQYCQSVLVLRAAIKQYKHLVNVIQKKFESLATMQEELTNYKSVSKFLLHEKSFGLVAFVELDFVVISNRLLCKFWSDFVSHFSCKTV